MDRSTIAKICPNHGTNLLLECRRLGAKRRRRAAGVCPWRTNGLRPAHRT